MKKADVVIWHFRVERPMSFRLGDTHWYYGGEVIAPKNAESIAVELLRKLCPDYIGRPILRYKSPVHGYNYEMTMPGAEYWKEAE